MRRRSRSPPVISSSSFSPTLSTILTIPSKFQPPSLILLTVSLLRYRAVKLTNKTIEQKLLPASGAFEILFSVGFEEAEDKLLLPLDANMRTVERFRDAVINIDKKVEAR